MFIYTIVVWKNVCLQRNWTLLFFIFVGGLCVAKEDDAVQVQEYPAYFIPPYNIGAEWLGGLA